VLAAIAALAARAEAAEPGITWSFELRSWTIQSSTGESTVSQWLAPIAVTVPLRSDLDVVLAESGGASRIEGSGTETRFEGLASPTLQGLWRIAGDRLLLQAGVTVPAGNRTLNNEEVSVARIVALPLLGFGMRLYGRGTELSTGLTYAAPSFGAHTSIGTGYITRFEYELFEGLADFRPAAEWVVSGGLDWGEPDREASGWLTSLDLTYRNFGRDQLGGVDVFEEGDELELSIASRSRAPGMRVHGTLGGELKADNLRIEPSPVAEVKVGSGHGAFAALGVTAPLGSTARAGLELETHHVFGSDTSGRDGRAFQVGSVLELVREWVTLEARGGYAWGRLDGDGGSGQVDLTGYVLGGGVRWWWGR
jgi:hypothetical protein